MGFVGVVLGLSFSDIRPPKISVIASRVFRPASVTVPPIDSFKDSSSGLSKTFRPPSVIPLVMIVWCIGATGQILR